MRSRREIEKDIYTISQEKNSARTIEVLLDIRDILEKIANKPAIWDNSNRTIDKTAI